MAPQFKVTAQMGSGKKSAYNYDKAADKAYTAQQKQQQQQLIAEAQKQGVRAIPVAGGDVQYQTPTGWASTLEEAVQALDADPKGAALRQQQIKAAARQPQVQEQKQKMNDAVAGGIGNTLGSFAGAAVLQGIDQMHPLTPYDNRAGDISKESAAYQHARGQLAIAKANVDPRTIASGQADAEENRKNANTVADMSSSNEAAAAGNARGREDADVQAAIENQNYLNKEGDAANEAGFAEELNANDNYARGKARTDLKGVETQINGQVNTLTSPPVPPQTQPPTPPPVPPEKPVPAAAPPEQQAPEPQEETVETEESKRVKNAISGLDKVPGLRGIMEAKVNLAELQKTLLPLSKANDAKGWAEAIKPYNDVVTDEMNMITSTDLAAMDQKEQLRKTLIGPNPQDAAVANTEESGYETGGGVGLETKTTTTKKNAEGVVFTKDANGVFKDANGNIWPSDRRLKNIISDYRLKQAASKQKQQNLISSIYRRF